MPLRHLRVAAEYTCTSLGCVGWTNELCSSSSKLSLDSEPRADGRAPDKEVLANDSRESLLDRSPKDGGSVPDSNVMFTGDIVEYHSACYCGDGHFHDWPDTLEEIRAWDVDAIAPGRGDALVGKEMVNAALDKTTDFVTSTYDPVAKVAVRGGSLKEAWDACRAECDPKFSDYAIYEHCLPFNVARAYDEALDIDTPRIWTAERDRKMWDALQG